MKRFVALRKNTVVVIGQKNNLRLKAGSLFSWSVKIFAMHMYIRKSVRFVSIAICKVFGYQKEMLYQCTDINDLFSLQFIKHILYKYDKCMYLLILMHILRSILNVNDVDYMHVPLPPIANFNNNVFGFMTFCRECLVGNPGRHCGLVRLFADGS